MFGFTLQKLLVLAAIVAAVWYAFKFVGRLDQRRKREIKAGRAGANPAGGAATDAGVPEKPEEMVQCPVCESYVAAQGVGPCGRDDCPY